MAKSEIKAVASWRLCDTILSTGFSRPLWVIFNSSLCFGEPFLQSFHSSSLVLSFSMSLCFPFFSKGYLLLTFEPTWDPKWFQFATLKYIYMKVTFLGYNYVCRQKSAQKGLHLRSMSGSTGNYMWQCCIVWTNKESGWEAHEKNKWELLMSRKEVRDKMKFYLLSL